MKTLTLLITLFIFSACSKQLHEEMLQPELAAVKVGKAEEKSFYYYGVIHHNNGCITEMTAWATYSMVGWVQVTTYYYNVVQTCGSTTVTTFWQSKGRESTDSEMITELRKAYSDFEIAEILKTIKAEKAADETIPAKKYLYNFGVQGNGCTLYALMVVQSISVGVLSYYDISVYEVCPSASGPVTHYLHYEIGLGWWRAPETDLLTQEQKALIEEGLAEALK